MADEAQRLTEVTTDDDRLLNVTMTARAAANFKAALLFASVRIPEHVPAEQEIDHVDWLRWGVGRIDVANEEEAKAREAAESVEITELHGVVRALVSALERTLANGRAVLNQKPVRDWDEMEAEVESALALAERTMPCPDCGEPRRGGGLIGVHKLDCPRATPRG